MKYLLDTNVWIVYFSSRDAQLRARLDAGFDADELATCTVVIAELLYSALQSNQRERNVEAVDRILATQPILTFDLNAAKAYATIRDAAARRGAPTDPMDLLIAAIAVANDLVVVTHNLKHFNPLPGVRAESWQTN